MPIFIFTILQGNREIKDSGPNDNRRYTRLAHELYEGWNFNSGNYLFTTDTK